MYPSAPVLEAEEAAVDPVLRPRLLAEAAHAAVAVELGDAELELGPHHGHRGETPVLAVKARSAGGGRCRPRRRRRWRRTSAPRAAVPACWIRPPVGVSMPVSTQRDRHAVGPFVRADDRLDQLALEASAEEEAPQPVSRVDPDHVPQDRLAADLHQRLGDRGRVLLQPRPAAAAENHHVVQFRHQRLDYGPARRGRADRTGPIGSPVAHGCHSTRPSAGAASGPWAAWAGSGDRLIRPPWPCRRDLHPARTTRGSSPSETTCSVRSTRRARVGGPTSSRSFAPSTMTCGRSCLPRSTNCFRTSARFCPTCRKRGCNRYGTARAAPSWRARARRSTRSCRLASNVTRSGRSQEPGSSTSAAAGAG